MQDPYPVRHLPGPLNGKLRPPGSKSLTNRALVVSALAVGQSTLRGVLQSRDTEVMTESLRQLGLQITVDPAAESLQIFGCTGRPLAPGADLWLENSGTSIRFLAALCTLGSGSFRLDGNARMRERPIGDLVRALNELGADVRCEFGNDCPPVNVSADGLPGGRATVAGNISSQYLSALLMVAPCAEEAVRITVQGDLVSRPYVDMTLDVMAQFGVDVDEVDDGDFSIEPQFYEPRVYDVEPDASAASYWFAAAAVTGGRVTVEGLSRMSLQGDIGFVEVLERMGCGVTWGAAGVTVTGGPLRGIDVDMNAISDTAQTLAAVAPFADGPTRIRNVAHMRHKETDRVLALVSELRRLGLEVEEEDDGLTIFPGPMQPALIETYDDHRMAMSFAILGLRQPGVTIADPECVAKTYPRFFHDLEQLCEANG